MANGGWYGTREEWEQAEAPLRRLDPVIERFAKAHGFGLLANYKDWPSRHLEKAMPLSCLLQVWRAELTEDAWNLWACCSEDRGKKRFWRQELLGDRISMDELEASIEPLLEAGLKWLKVWSANPQTLEFATYLSPLRSR